MNSCQTLIVGGGLSGVFLALKLSRESSLVEKGITLVEQLPTLGGRLFTGGLGFEVYSPESLEILYRHLCATLSEDEVSFLEDAQWKQNASYVERNSSQRFFVVRKEFTSSPQFFSSSSEILTKKEAESFSQLVFTLAREYEQQGGENWDQLLFTKTSYWTSLPKNTREVFSSILNTLFGDFWEKARASVVIVSLNSYFEQFKKNIPEIFQRFFHLELALEELLKRRGVHIKTSTLLTKLEHQGKDAGFRVYLSSSLENTSYFVKNLCVTLPLVSSLTLIPKEMLSASQSRFVSRVRPVSLVLLELQDFAALKNEIWPSEISGGERLLFPIEKVQAHMSADNSKLSLFCYLDYEHSLQAPSVREAIARLRRAAARLFLPTAQNELKGMVNFGDAKTGLKQRIVLLPVAHSVPLDAYLNVELSQVESSVKGLYFCGDSFPAYKESWGAVVNTVQQVFESLARGG